MGSKTRTRVKKWRNLQMLKWQLHCTCVLVGYVMADFIHTNDFKYNCYVSASNLNTKLSLICEKSNRGYRSVGSRY